MHFFSELAFLNQQGPTNTYGPDNLDLQNKFNVSAAFTVSQQTRVFACQESLMVVQPYKDASGTINPDLVNVILKPMGGLQILFRPVKYYLYRGLAKNAFISGTAVTPASTPDKTEFIDNFWKKWNKFKTDIAQPGLPDPTPKSFGFDIALADTYKIEELFNSKDSQSVAINDIQAIQVKEGEWIGNIPATAEFNFEIITNTDQFAADLGYVRKLKHVIDVTALAGAPSTPEISFQLRVEREKILNYIDPAAFFGMHYTVGVKVSTYPLAGKSTVPKKLAALYTDVLVKFLTKNRIYVDIRSEKGYHYNFYKNYGGGATDLLKIKALPATNFTTSPYYTNSWPVYYTDTSFNSKVIQIQLRVDDNIKPMLFLENPKLLGAVNKNNFVQETGLLNGTAVDWTKTVKLEVPNFGTGTNQANIAHHVQLQYFRRKNNPASPVTVLKPLVFWMVFLEPFVFRCWVFLRLSISLKKTNGF